MESVKLGELIPEGVAAYRDCVHVAVYPAVAGEEIRPGDPVDVGDDGRAFVSTESPVGVADPFLTSPIPEGSRFYVCITPGTVTGVRHAWQHPRFRAKVSV